MKIKLKMMKKHLFYTLLAIFSVTAFVTLLGIVGALKISAGYLTALVTALLVESAGAIVALFRKADFFTNDDDKYTVVIARMQEEEKKLLGRLDESESRRGRIEQELERLSEQNRLLQHEVEEHTDLQLRVMAVLGGEALSLDMILNRLELNNFRGRQKTQGVIGKLLQDGVVESNLAGYYKLKQEPGTNRRT